MFFEGELESTSYCLLVGVCLHGNINFDLVLFYTVGAYMREIVETN